MITFASLGVLGSMEVISAAVVGFGYTAWMVWRKLKDIKDTTKSKPSAHTSSDARDSMFAIMSRERQEAIQQRDIAHQMSNDLREANQTLKSEMRDFAREIEDLKNKISLLSELNRRLSLSLDAAQIQITQITQTMSRIPEYRQGSSFVPEVLEGGNEESPPSPEQH